MKKCKCRMAKVFFKILKIFLIANIALFVVFFFDLDGKLMFNVVEPFLKKHYDNMERKDTLKAPYEMNKFPKYSYDS